ncbi:MAG: type II secretion system F family protein [Acidobacteriaceae bacterium]|nr:type II secretion system F family protein [Acidobacteriaceae bacterium]
MLLAAIVFLAVFLVSALLITATGTGASERVKQTLARLDALLVAEGKKKDEQVDLRKQELFSSIPLLNRVLLRLEIAPKLRRLLYQANVRWTPGGLILVSFSTWVFAAYLVYMKTGAFFFSLLLALVPASVPFGYVYWKRTKRFRKFEEGLPAALDLMVSGLRGGNSLVSVLGLAAREAQDPVGPEFRITFDEQNYGLELRTALDNLAVRVPIQDIKMVTTAVLIQKETGGNLAEVLDKCAQMIRERFRLKQEIRTKTAQGRLTGWVLTFMPVTLAALLYIVRPDVISLLWTRPAGIKMIYTGIVMILIGGLIIRKIVNIRV